MAKVTVSKKFSYSPNGYEVITVAAGEQELDDIAIQKGKELGIIEDTKPARRSKAKAKTED